MRQRAEEAAERVVFWKGESEALRLQKDSYAESLKALRFERDDAIARAERVEDINKRLFNACRERNTRISDLMQRAELAERFLCFVAQHIVESPVLSEAHGEAVLEGILSSINGFLDPLDDAMPFPVTASANEGHCTVCRHYDVSSFTGCNAAPGVDVCPKTKPAHPADASTMVGDHISQPGKKVGERELRLVELVKEAFLQGFDAKDSEVSAPISEASYSERAEVAWECSDARAALAEMEQKS